MDVRQRRSFTKESVALIGQGSQQLDIRFNDQSDKARRVVQYPLSSMLIGKQVAPRFYEGRSEAMLAGKSDAAQIKESN